jgi:hypothetical protein
LQVGKSTYLLALVLSLLTSSTSSSTSSALAVASSSKSSALACSVAGFLSSYSSEGDKEEGEFVGGSGRIILYLLSVVEVGREDDLSDIASTKS